MILKTAKILSLTLAILVLGGCATYSISEQDMTNYLHDNISIEQSVGVENVMYAQISVHDLKVNIGRADADRVSVLASTSAQVQMLSSQKKQLDLDLEFSAIPEYDKESGEVFLKAIRLDQFDEKSQLLTPEIKQFIKPAVSMIGYALSSQPVYKLDSNKVQEALLKSAEPNLVIKNNQLVINLLD